ncbi:MAG: hypothetical protein ACSLE6_09040 [Mycobacterium sp.]
MVFATSALDVLATVRFAAERGLTVAVPATGPGALPLGQHTIVAHTAGVPVEPLNRTAYVGAGTTWQRVMDAATPYVLSALVTLIGGTLVLCGVVLAVGVVGFLAAAG